MQVRDMYWTELAVGLSVLTLNRNVSCSSSEEYLQSIDFKYNLILGGILAAYVKINSTAALP